MRITKGQGFIIVMLMTTLSMFLYLSYFSRSVFEASSYNWATWCFLVGLLFSRFGVNDVGSHGYLAFNGSAVRDDDGSYIVWEDGMYFIPTFLPALNVIGVPLGWTMKHASVSAIPVRPPTQEEDHHVFIDQRLPRYNINSDVGYWQQTFSRLLENLIGWMFRFDPTNEFRYQKIGSILMVFGLVGGWGMKQKDDYFPPKQRTTDQPSNSSNWSIPLSSNRNNQSITQPAVTPQVQASRRSANDFTVNIAYGAAPRYPSENAFLTRQKAPGQQFAYRDSGDGLLYFWYVVGDNEASVHMPSGGCKIVPAGERVLLRPDTPPRYVINMTKQVEYYVYGMSLPESERSFIVPNSSQLKSRTWEHLRNNWGTVDLKEGGIIATALRKDELAPSQYGGLVCF